ncbi:MAG: DUF5131 family protein, partial [Gammaproteobacteria bacterium]|nr:DUF5131 family protein [Gammaproteobacteria bacterium]
VWLGVSAEDQARADERIPHLLETPAAVRFVSAEPLLGPVDFTRISSSPHGAMNALSLLPGARRLDWIIVGGESGRNARPFDLAWARSLVQQCHDAGVPCFVKQFGAFPTNGGGPGTIPTCIPGIRDRKGGDPAEWPEDLRIREFPR